MIRGIGARFLAALGMTPRGQPQLANRPAAAGQSSIINRQSAIIHRQSCGYMDDGFDHAVTVVGDQVESLLGFGEGEMVCHKLIEVDGAV